MRANVELIIANILFGVNYSVIVSLLSDWLNFKQLFMVQLVVGALLFAPALKRQQGQKRLRSGDILPLASLSLITIFGWIYLLLWGGSMTTPMDMASLASLSPSFTLITSYLLGRERVNVWRVMGIVISLIGGVILISSRISPAEGTTVAHGNALVVAATLCIAVNTVVIKPELSRFGAARLLAIYYIFSLAVALPLMGGELLDLKFSGISTMRFLELGYLAVAGSALPLYLLYIGVSHSRPIYSALFRYIQPLIALCVVLWQGSDALDEVNLLAVWVMIVGFIFLYMTRGEEAESIIK